LIVLGGLARHSLNIRFYGSGDMPNKVMSLLSIVATVGIDKLVGILEKLKSGIAGLPLGGAKKRTIG
jgi:hypothetical protein